MADALTTEQITALIHVADYVTDEWAEGAGEYFELLLELGLIVPVPGGYDSEQHMTSAYDLEPGDPYYEVAQWLVGAINRLRRAKDSGHGS